MSTENFSSNPLNFQPEQYSFPEDFNDSFRIRLTQNLNNLAIALNAKENGFYFDNEVPTGRLFIPRFTGEGSLISASTNFSFRPVYRLVIDFGALPNNATKSVAHGITTDENYSIVHLYGTATNPGASTLTSAIPIPSASSVGADNVQLEMDATNINITTGIDRTAYTRTFVVIEYIKEV